MIYGTKARNSPALPPEKTPADEPTEAIDVTNARQSAAEPWREDAQVSRRDYFKSLIPGLGELVVRSLRNVEHWKRELKNHDK